MKYTFPVVRAVIDRIGPPREIGKVDPNQHGPLLVTLTVDLASDCVRDILSHLETSSAKKCPPKESLIPDLFEGLPVRSDGAGQILLRNNARWWTEFAKRSEAKFRGLAEGTGPLRFLLRSAGAGAAANKVAAGDITYDAAWLHIAKNPRAYFSLPLPLIAGLASLNEVAIRKWRSMLIQENKSQQEWIHRHAGGFHPSTSSYWDEKLRRIKEFPMWRARNELYYCLAQGGLGWLPLSSDSFSQADWQKWVEKAKSASPPYFSLTSSRH